MCFYHKVCWDRLNCPNSCLWPIPILKSVTRLGDFWHFGQPFKAGGNNYFTQIAHIVRQFL